MPTRNTYVVLVALIGVVLLFGGLGASYQESGYEHTVTNEAVIVDDGNTSQVDAPDYTFTYSDSINVTVSSGQLKAGEDYTWNSTTGTITWINTSNSEDGETARVDYSYTAPTQGTHNRTNVLSLASRAVPYAALALGIGATLKLAEMDI